MKILITWFNWYVWNILYKNFVNNNTIYWVSKTSENVWNIYRCDCADLDDVIDLSKKIEPEIIIHAAWNKNLKWCEANPDEAKKTNWISIENIVKVWWNKAKIIFISSDYVFDWIHWNYKEDSLRNPQTIYWKTKVYWEEYWLNNSENFYVVRLSALYDLNATFPKFIRESLENRISIDCFTNIFYSPTYYKNFLSVIEWIINKWNKNMKNKIFHCEWEKISRYDFAYKYAKVFWYDSDFIKPVEEELNNFLPWDLSLNNEITLDTLWINNISIEDALYELNNNENI